MIEGRLLELEKDFIPDEERLLEPLILNIKLYCFILLMKGNINNIKDIKEKEEVLFLAFFYNISHFLLFSHLSEIRPY